MNRFPVAFLAVALALQPLLGHAFTIPSFALPKHHKPQQSASALFTSIDDIDPDEACFLDTAEDCIDLDGYKATTASFATVTQVFVAEVESLRDRFESFEQLDSKPNVIKFNKRRLEGNHHVYQAANSTLHDHSSSTATNGASRNNKNKNKPSSSTSNSHIANLEYNELIEEGEVVLVDTVRKPGMASVSRAFPRAGPRRTLHFDPSTVNAAVLTAGGLCPGLNNVIRELVHALKYLYGADKVYGITGGFHGFHKPEYPPVMLDCDMVENIHHDGGTVLRSSRGGFDMDKILEFLQAKNISQLYIIGGDGTHRGAYAIHQACVERNLNIAVAGIPKTIDNDVDYIDRSFGFQSAVEAAQAAIRTAKTEAMCNVPNGIGICKLMGRSAGFLAAFAALGSGDVDLVLVPEVPIVLEGPNGILPFLRRRIQEQKYAVVVVAEGAGEELLGVSETLDAGGNRALPEIGPFLLQKTNEYFTRFDEECTIKYIDPSYTVRSVHANAADSLYCQQLAIDAVHGCMAGLTGFSVGVVNKSPVLIPIPQLVASSPRNMDPYGITWERILAMTGQPNTAPPKERSEAATEGSSATTISNGDELILLESGMPEPSAH